VNRLRAWAVQSNFSRPLPLLDAVEQLGFVQADPIRSPARAQDLILRQRVPGYRTGDLETSYSHADLEEDFFYAYGFMPRSTWRLLHPKKTGALKALELRVHELVLELGEAHPSAVSTQLGTRRATNAWGGYSTASTRALHYLHWYGLLRVVRRESGTRVYMPARVNADPLAAGDERIRRAVMLLARILAPVPEASLRQALSLLKYAHLPAVRTRAALAELVKSGELVKEAVDGVAYLWPATFPAVPGEPPARVRILAPFDPLVWDRRRFEHLWGWAYRFEAYTPAPKRKLGYYAMPMLWRDRIVGWANASVASGKLVVEPGFVGARPKGRDFRLAYEEEVESLAASLGAA
jgi:uncharacterized protein YcaQ